MANVVGRFALGRLILHSLIVPHRVAHCIALCRQSKQDVDIPTAAMWQATRCSRFNTRMHNVSIYPSFLRVLVLSRRVVITGDTSQSYFGSSLLQPTAPWLVLQVLTIKIGVRVGSFQFCHDFFLDSDSIRLTCCPSANALASITKLSTRRWNDSGSRIKEISRTFDIPAWLL